jgi:hypothetical protein
MEMSQGNTLYIYLNKQKYHFFLQNWKRAKQVLFGGLIPVGGERI